MSTARISFLFVAACFLLAFATASSLQAQVDLDALQERVRDLVPPDQGGGHTIDESQMILAYVAAVVGFLIVFVLTWVLVRLIAALTIVACFLGGALLMWWMVYQGWLTTWEQLGWITLGIGISTGVTAITASLFLDKGSGAPADVGKLQAQQTRMQQEIEALSRDLRNLRDRAGRA